MISDLTVGANFTVNSELALSNLFHEWLAFNIYELTYVSNNPNSDKYNWIIYSSSFGE